MLFHIFCIRHRNICLTFAFWTLAVIISPTENFNNRRRRSLSCRHSCRGSSEAYWKLGVELYCECISSKIVGDVKMALYCQRSVSCDGDAMANFSRNGSRNFR